MHKLKGVKEQFTWPSADLRLAVLKLLYTATQMLQVLRLISLSDLGVETLDTLESVLATAVGQHGEDIR